MKKIRTPNYFTVWRILISLFICMVYLSLAIHTQAFDMPRRTDCSGGGNAEQNCACTCVNPDSCNYNNKGSQNCSGTEIACCTTWETCYDDGHSKTWQCGGAPVNTPTPSPTTTPTRTPTPTPTATRTPTPTPTITSTPTPTLTSTPIPSPTLPPDACQCDSFIYNGVFTAGETADFTSFAKVNVSTYPDAKVNGITFHVERDGTEIATSDEVSADGPVRRLEGAIPFDVYNSIWRYDVPSEGNGEVAYRVWTQIACGSKTGMIIQKSNIAGASIERKVKISFFEKLNDFFSRLVAIIKNSQPLAWIKPPESNVLSAQVKVQDEEVVVPTQPMSIKYSNFTPASLITQTCSEMTFHLIYN